MAKLTCPDCGTVNLEAGPGSRVSGAGAVGCRCGYQYSAKDIEAFQRQLHCTLCRGQGTVKSPYSSNKISCPNCSAEMHG